jgi:argininosuccinate lyase
MKLWGGRFNAGPSELMERFNASIGFDWRLWKADVTGSIAYARALQLAGVLTTGELDALAGGLQEILKEFQSGNFELLLTDEDIHTAVERRLGEIIGEVAGKLHTGRSRNDQVATDLRLFLMGEVVELRQMLMELQGAILKRARQHLEVLMPGYTHMQRAQPVQFSHWLMSYFWMLQRDLDRLHGLDEHLSVLPLGSGALAGISWSVNRELMATELGFRTVSQNSMDAVSDRDFVAEFLFWASLLQVHLSRLAEDLIVFSSAEFGFVELDDAFATGSSLLPQKRNPDSLELLRGKAGRVLGGLVTLLTVLKGLPSTYNKDLQEDKEPLFDALDTVRLSLPVAAGVVRTLRINAETMGRALDDALLAADLAEYLVRRGVPFRQSHSLVGSVIKRAEVAGILLHSLPLAQFQAVSELFDEDLYDVLNHRRSVESRKAAGGTATAALQRQMDQASAMLRLPP